MTIVYHIQGGIVSTISYSNTFEKISSGNTRNVSKTPDSVYVKKIPMEKGSRVLCLSEGREKKEMAMDALKEQRFLDDLNSLGVSVKKGHVN